MHDEHNQTSSSVDSSASEPTGGVAPAPPWSVAKLTSARMPADRGISSLGLLMQLGGVLGIIAAGLVAMSTAFGGAGAVTGAFFLVAVLSGVRSACARAAGAKLLYGTGSEPMRGMRTYLLIAAVHTIASLALLHGYLDTAGLLKWGLFFAAWPLAMLVFFSRPHVRELISDGVPHAEDYGFEGAAVLMTLFGIMGTLFSAYVLRKLLQNIDAAFSTPASGILVLVIMALLVRSVIHTLAGLNGISGATFEECNASAARYYNYGIVSSICIGVTMFVVVLMSAQSMGFALVLGGIMTPLLLTWPQILRRLYSERNFHVFLEDNKAQTYQRAPDAGLIALGWTLVAVALMILAQGLADALMAPDTINPEARSAWWSVGVGGLQLWAGIELIRMSQGHKLAAMIYALVSVGVVIYLLWPAVDSLDELLANAFAGGPAVDDMGLLITGFPLILAVGTIVLVNRVTVPSAVVHVRKGRAPAT